MNKIFLDIETTGLNFFEDKIIEISCLKMKFNNFEDSEFNCYINPKKSISKEAYMIHGISNNFLKEKPTFKDICPKFINFIKNKTLVIHNSKFDIKFLNKELIFSGYKKISFYCSKIIDTLIISKKLFPNSKNSLKYLSKRFNINEFKRLKHSAIIDCKILKVVFINLVMIVNKILIKKIYFKKKFHYNYNNNRVSLKKKDILLNNYLFKKI